MALIQFEPHIYLSGALIPADYEDSQFWKDIPENENVSLQSLCIEKLISNCHYLFPKKQPIPSTIMHLLMNNAIFNGRHLSIKELLKIWPYETITFSLPYGLKTWKSFAKMHNDDLRNLIIGVKSVFQNFIQPNNNLKIIDFSEVPLQDEQVNFISQIVINERLINSDVNYILYLNCIIYTKQTFLKLKSALMANKERTSQVKIVIKQFHLAPSNCGYEYCLSEFLQLLNPHELTTLSYNFFHDCQQLWETHKQTGILHSLKMLNFAYNKFDKNLNGFMNLEALDISHCQRLSSLEDMLKNLYDTQYKCCPTETSSQLKYLSVQNCLPIDSSSDICFLVYSSISNSLINLNLGGNMLNIKSLITLFEACGNLQILELSNCKFNDSNLKPLFEGFSLMKKLRYLNIDFEMSLQVLLLYAPFLAEIPMLRYLRISPIYPCSVRGTNLNPKTFADDLYDSIVSYFNSSSRKFKILA